MDLLAWIILSVIASATCFEPTIVKEDVGVVYHKMGKLITTKDRIFVHIALERPSLNVQPMPIILSNHCGTGTRRSNDTLELQGSEPATVLHAADLMDIKTQICTDFYKAYYTYNNTATRISDLIQDKLNDIDVTVEGTRKMNVEQYTHNRTLSGKRQKRFIASIIGLIRTAVDVGLQIHSNRRMDSIVSAMQTLKSSQNKQLNMIKSLRDDTLIFKRELIGLASEVNNSVLKLASKLDHAVRHLDIKLQQVSIELADLKKNLDGYIRLMSNIAGPYSAILTSAVDNLQSYLQYVTRISDGISTMARGQLSPQLLSPSTLASILNDTKEHLERQTLADVRLIDVPITEIYSRKNVVFAMNDQYILVQLELMLESTKGRRYDLFRIETLPVPINMSDISNEEKPHTMIKVEHPYFGIHDDSYTSLSDEQFRLCETYRTTTVCPSFLVETEIGEPSCLSELYLNRTGTAIEKLCNILYFHRLKPRPHVIDAGDYLLIASLDTPWTYRCKSESTMPEYTGIGYAKKKKVPTATLR